MGKAKTDVDCDISEEQFREVLPRFVGEILQTPPMFSAISKNGVRLYDLARQGIEVEREKRPVTVYSIDFIEKTGKKHLFGGGFLLGGDIHPHPCRRHRKGT